MQLLFSYSLFMSVTIVASASLFTILMVRLFRGASVSSKLLSLIHRLTTDSAPAVTMAAMAANAYSSNVAKILPPTNVPEVAHGKPHHVVKSGRVVGYKNPHASYDPPHPWEHVAKYAPSSLPPISSCQANLPVGQCSSASSNSPILKTSTSTL